MRGRWSDLGLAAPVQTRIRAGVVGWRGGAILIPAASGAGTSTLVEELVRLGAEYYSDEWAVLDEAGRVHPFARPTLLRAGAAPLEVPTRECPPLPLALVVATAYQPGSVWEPLILQGARALLPLIDNAVLLREQPAVVLRLAGRLGSSIVTIESPRPEAAAVAPAILEFADAVLAGQLARFTTVRHPSTSRPGARVVAVEPEAAPETHLHRAVYLRIEDFLALEERREILEYARAREKEFHASAVYEQDEPDKRDISVRRSGSLYQLDERLADFFEPRLRALLPHVRRELGIPWFRLASIERQIHVHRSGDFFTRHVDNGVGEVAARRVSAVYYFHEVPKRFDGGLLYLYHELEYDERREIGPYCVAIEPLDNSLIFFPSDTVHEVEPVRLRDGDFRASRFTVSFWFREDETWEPAGLPLRSG